MCLSNLIPFNNLPAKELRYLRVWKGIFGNRDFTKIRCGIREKAKCIGMIRDLTATREAGFAKIWARDEGFFLSVGNSGSRTSGKCESTRRRFNGVSYGSKL